MRDHLVAVKLIDSDEEQSRLVTEGMWSAAFPFFLEEPDPERREYINRIPCWKCEERDVPLVVAHLSKYFPGKDIEVLKLISIHFRPLGEVQTKTVTKDGILPA